MRIIHRDLMLILSDHGGTVVESLRSIESMGDNRAMSYSIFVFLLEFTGRALYTSINISKESTLPYFAIRLVILKVTITKFINK